MKDLGSLMKQAQAMQQKLADAQARSPELSVEGTAGGGTGHGHAEGHGRAGPASSIDEEPAGPGEGEMVADLIVAAHADAKTQARRRSRQVLMREAAGRMAGMTACPACRSSEPWPPPPDPRSSG